MTNIESGNKLVKEAEKIFFRDLKAAKEEGDYNMVVRRAQEVVELLLKGALKILGIDYPKIHDVGEVFIEKVQEKYPSVDRQLLEKIRDISMWLGESRAPSFYFEKDYTEEDAEKAYGDANFLIKEVKSILGK